MNAFFLCNHVAVLDSFRCDAQRMTMPENTEPSPDESPETGDAGSAWIAERVSTLLQAKGIPTRQQAAFLAELCALSFSQARRKLRGAMWTFTEIQTIAQRFEVSIDQWFLAKDAPHPEVDVAGDDSRSPHLPPLQDAQMLLGPHRVRRRHVRLRSPRRASSPSIRG